MIPASDVIMDAYGYSKKIAWVGKGDYITRKTEYYDLDGKLVKSMVTNKIIALDKEKGIYQAADVVMTNVQNNRMSEFVTDKCAINPDMKDDIFTTDSLKK